MASGENLCFSIGCSAVLFQSVLERSASSSFWAFAPVSSSSSDCVSSRSSTGLSFLGTGLSSILSLSEIASLSLLNTCASSSSSSSSWGMALGILGILGLSIPGNFCSVGCDFSSFAGSVPSASARPKSGTKPSSGISAISGDSSPDQSPFLSISSSCL